MLQVALWSSIPHVVHPSAVGTANGIASCMLDLTVGSTSLIIGQIMSKSDRCARIDSCSDLPSLANTLYIA